MQNQISMNMNKKWSLDGEICLNRDLFHLSNTIINEYFVFFCISIYL